MKIETKYDVGQTVWWCECSFHIHHHGYITRVLVQDDGFLYEIFNADRTWLKQEDSIFGSYEEMRKHSLLEEKKFILGQLDKIECELNELEELEKEEKTENDAE